MSQTINPYRDEIAGYLLRAACHFGHTFREEEDGLSVDEAASNRGIGRAQLSSCRRSVHRVLNGEFSANPTQAGYDEAVYRALLHFSDEMSVGLRQQVITQLARFKAEYLPNLKVEPLQCKYASGVLPKSTTQGRPFDSPAPFEDDEQLPGPETDTSLQADFPTEDVSPDRGPGGRAAIDEAGPGGPGYATAEEIRQVDDLAMKLALVEAERRWPEAMVKRMPHNNPGFDVEVCHRTGDTRYVEVKGTRTPEPCFFITAGEVAYSREHPERYSIWIFHAMDLDLGTATLTEHDGPVTAAHFALQPVQYRGRFTGTG